MSGTTDTEALPKARSKVDGRTLENDSALALATNLMPLTA